MNQGELVEFGRSQGYQAQVAHVSKYHLCADVRRHLFGVDNFAELWRRQFYEQLEA